MGWGKGIEASGGKWVGVRSFAMMILSDTACPRYIVSLWPSVLMLVNTMSKLAVIAARITLNPPFRRKERSSEGSPPHMHHLPASCRRYHIAHSPSA